MMLPRPWGPFPIVGSIHRWFPLWFPEISNQDQHTGLTWWAQLGSNQRPLACKASALPLSYAPLRSGRRKDTANAASVPVSRAVSCIGRADASACGADNSSGGQNRGSFGIKETFPGAVGSFLRVPPAG